MPLAIQQNIFVDTLSELINCDNELFKYQIKKITQDKKFRPEHYK